MNTMTSPILIADDYFNPVIGPRAAVEYVARRYVDAADLRSTLQWTPYIDGIMRCEIYGHTILWDVRGTVLHPGAEYELTPRGTSGTLTGSLQQVLAFILARNW